MNDNKLFHFEETSTKNGLNIEEVFKKAVFVIYEGYLRYLENNQSELILNSNSIYNSINSNRIKLRVDPNKIDESKETNAIENKFCLC